MVKLSQQTKPIKQKDITRKWHLVDAKNKILGRLSTQIALKLIGKEKRNYVSYLDIGDYVVVINAAQVKLSGKKTSLKEYTRYSGYPGGLKKIPFLRIFQKNPGEVIKLAVLGMLPKNKLRKQRIARLLIYKNDKHPHANKF